MGTSSLEMDAINSAEEKQWLQVNSHSNNNTVLNSPSPMVNNQACKLNSHLWLHSKPSPGSYLLIKLLNFVSLQQLVLQQETLALLPLQL